MRDSSGPFQAHPVTETRGCQPACGSRNRVQGATGAPPFNTALPRGSELTSSAVHRLRARQEAVTSARRDQSGPSGRPCLGTSVRYLICYLGIHFQTRAAGAAVGTRACLVLAVPLQLLQCPPRQPWVQDLCHGPRVALLSAPEKEKAVHGGVGLAAAGRCQPGALFICIPINLHVAGYL